MAGQDSGDVTALLNAIRDGREDARHQLLQLVYAHLRPLAADLMRQERAGHTLQPTAVVHEAFLRLFQGSALASVPNRRYFFAAASRCMLEVLVDHARARGRLKRGGAYRRVPLDDVLDRVERHLDVITLREALDELSALDERQSQVVLLRFLFEYTVEEVAEQLEVSVSTVESDWRLARAWLRRRLGDA